MICNHTLCHWAKRACCNSGFLKKIRIPKLGQARHRDSHHADQLNASIKLTLSRMPPTDSKQTHKSTPLDYLISFQQTILFQENNLHFRSLHRKSHPPPEFPHISPFPPLILTPSSPPSPNQRLWPTTTPKSESSSSHGPLLQCLPQLGQNIWMQILQNPPRIPWLHHFSCITPFPLLTSLDHKTHR